MPWSQRPSSATITVLSRQRSPASSGPLPEKKHPDWVIRMLRPTTPNRAQRPQTIVLEDEFPHRIPRFVKPGVLTHKRSGRRSRNSAFEGLLRCWREADSGHLRQPARNKHRERRLLRLPNAYPRFVQAHTISLGSIVPPHATHRRAIHPSRVARFPA